MVVDSSVLIAILLGEDDAQQFIQLLADAEKIYISDCIRQTGANHSRQTFQSQSTLHYRQARGQ